MKIGICGNCNINILAEALDELCHDDEIIVGDNNYWKDEIRNPPEDFCKLDYCIVAVDWQLLAPLVYDYTWNDNFDNALTQFTDKCKQIKNLLFLFRIRCTANIFIFSPLSPHTFSTGFITRLLDNSPQDLFIHINQAFNTLCRSVTDCYPIDMNEISFLSRTKIDYDNSPHSIIDSDVFLFKSIAEHCRKMITQFQHYPIKCIVLDLDNTLWGGVIGENSIESIILSKDGSGRAFFDFQRELLKFYRQGVFLAVCSKNNTCDALEVIENHPHMLIRPSMISAFRINWNDKPGNIISIAKELSIDLNSILFIDDTPSERALMKATLPEIETLDLPEDPAGYVKVLRNCSRLWPVQLTVDDLHKRTFFSMEKLRKNSANIEKCIVDFLRKSELKLLIRKADTLSIPRITQLFNKTNQFNLTTKRYSQAEVEKIISEPDCTLFYMRMNDSFGDYGLIGAALIFNSTIDSFLISCRALGKNAENAFLWYILNFMKENGLKTATGIYIPTLKNVQTENFYKTAGFELKEKNTQITHWTYDLSKKLFTPPDWFEFI